MEIHSVYGQIGMELAAVAILVCTVPVEYAVSYVGGLLYLEDHHSSAYGMYCSRGYEVGVSGFYVYAGKHIGKRAGLYRIEVLLAADIAVESEI